MTKRAKDERRRLTAPWLIAAGVTGAAVGVYLLVTAGPSETERLADLRCLAENVYYEARGEPLAGQYAVAEVTMNRVASRHFPDTVCEVVHAAAWSEARQRRVGAFSWTVSDSLSEPYGYEWRRAQAVASTVYANYREAPLVDGALFYHATYVTPAWVDGKYRVARIGRHLFYE